MAHDDFGGRLTLTSQDDPEQIQSLNTLGRATQSLLDVLQRGPQVAPESSSLRSRESSL